MQYRNTPSAYNLYYADSYGSQLFCMFNYDLQVYSLLT